MTQKNSSSLRLIALLPSLVLFAGALCLFIGALAVTPKQEHSIPPPASAHVTTARGSVNISLTPPVDPNKAAAITALGRATLRFEPNIGQTDTSVRFVAHAHGYNLFLTRAEAMLVLDKRKQRTRVVNPTLATAQREPKANNDEHVEPEVVTMKLAGDECQAEH